MPREVVSEKQSICMIIAFMTGTSSMMVMGIQAKKDIWISVILGLIGGLIIGLIFARIHRVFPGKNMYDVIEICFGKFLGKIVMILFIWHIYHAGSIVIRNISQFINTVSLPETPLPVPIIFITLLSIWAVREGIETIGRGSTFLIVPYVVSILFLFIFLIPKMDINNLRPILYEGIKPVLRGAALVFFFPFGEILIFSFIFSDFKSKKASYRVYLWGVLISGGILIFTSTSDILVVGIELATRLVYPSYVTTSHISIGNFIQRIEIISAIAFVMGGFVKVCVYMLAVCKGVSRVFGFKDYRFVVMGVGLLMLNLSYFIYEGVIEFSSWDLRIWPYYAFVFQVILPVIIYIIAEVKKPKGKKQKA